MYSNNTINKAMQLASAEMARLESIGTENVDVCISDGNVKIRKAMNVSLMPVMTCGNCKECKYLCYDIKACMQYPNTVIPARVRNTLLARKDPARYFQLIRNKLRRRRTNKYFRWHVAGDILDMDYFAEMVKIAREFPEFTFWTYTKMYHIVNAYCDANGVDTIPANLHIMFSEWRGMPMHNPYGFPEFRVVFKGETRPEGHYCPGNCDVCKASGRGCIAGETTYCLEH